MGSHHGLALGFAVFGIGQAEHVHFRWVAANPALDHSVASLAKRMDLSPRHFARLFRSEVGITPATWVEKARVSAEGRVVGGGQEARRQVAAHCVDLRMRTLRAAPSRGMSGSRPPSI